MLDENEQLIDRHILFDVKKMHYQRKPIRPNETDKVPYSIEIPANTKGPLTIETTLWYRIALQEIVKNIQKNLMPIPGLDGVIIPPVIMQQQTITVDMSNKEVK